MAKKKILQVKDIVKEFQAGPKLPRIFHKLTQNQFYQEPRRILNGISFELDEDLNLALLGPNGSGKTTLLKTLATLYLPDSGEIILDGINVVENLSEVRKHISFVSPDMQFQNKLTLRQTLEYFAKITDGDASLGMSFIRDLNLTHMLDERLESFSVGQKAITRLCVGLQKNPEFLFLDEVTSGLDAKRKQIVVDFLERQSKERTVILVDHDASVLDRVCDKVLLLRRGGTVDKLVSVEDLLKSFDYAYDILVLVKKQIPEERVRKIHERYQILADTIRYYVKDKEELFQVEQKLLELDELIEYRVSGISIDDIVLKWLVELSPPEVTTPFSQDSTSAPLQD